VSISHITVQPQILYFGTPVVLLSTENVDGTTNLAPMSSAWALGQAVVLGVGGTCCTARGFGVRVPVKPMDGGGAGAPRLPRSS